jgi:cell division protein FtsW
VSGAGLPTSLATTRMRRLRPLSPLQRRFLMSRLTRPDPWLLGAAAALIGLGVVMVLNVSYFHAQARFGDPLLFFRKHLIALAAGGVLFFAASRLRIEFLERWANVLFALSLLALALVVIPHVGIERGGAQRWLRIGGFSLQPTEFAKIGVVVFAARWIGAHREEIHDFRRGIAPLLLAVGLCAALVMLQPDFGTTVILGALTLLMLFAGGARPLQVGAMVVAGAGLFAAGALAAPYRVKRLFAFLDPWAQSQGDSFQLAQSLIAFGSGGATGVGLGNSHQKMFFLPEAHTDFIFALIGEELGLLGALAVLSLFALFAVRGYRVAARHPDSFGSLLAFGLTSVIVLSAVVNVGVVLGLLPTKGLALPFLSYGGSALLSAMLQVGILAALSRMTG